MCKKAVTLILVIAAVPLLCAASLVTRPMLRENIPAPRIISPADEEVVLEKGGPLVVKWSIHETFDSGPAQYDLRVYKGGEAVAPASVYKVKLDRRADRAEVPADIFEDGQMYTLALRKIYRRSGNSDWSYCTLSIKKIAE